MLGVDVQGLNVLWGRIGNLVGEVYLKVFWVWNLGCRRGGWVVSSVYFPSYFTC